MAERETGTVKWFNAGKGYGFVERDNGEGDVLSITAQLMEPASKRWTKDSGLNLMLLKVIRDLKRRMFKPWVKA